MVWTDLLLLRKDTNYPFYHYAFRKEIWMWNY